jgi:hypothetical protein
MRVVASQAARRHVEEHGGRLYVWVRSGRCTGATLRASCEAPRRRAFRLAGSAEGVDVFVPEARARLPDELHLELRRRPERVEAYWNGCAWVT